MPVTRENVDDNGNAAQSYEQAVAESRVFYRRRLVEKLLVAEARANPMYEKDAERIVRVADAVVAALKDMETA